MKSTDLLQLSAVLRQHGLDDMLSQIVVEPRLEEAMELKRSLPVALAVFDAHWDDWNGCSFTFYGVRVRLTNS